MKEGINMTRSSAVSELLSIAEHNMRVYGEDNRSKPKRGFEREWEEARDKTELYSSVKSFCGEYKKV